MWKDPIVEEIHAIRREISSECGDDLTKIMDRLRRNEAKTSGPLVDKEELRRRRAAAEAAAETEPQDGPGEGLVAAPRA